MKDINAVDWHSLVYYDETSPSGLRWKVERRTGNAMQIVKARPGDVAGGKNGRGYYCIPSNKINYTCHRVVMALHGIDITGLSVDHKDGNTSNNKIDNLRTVTQAVNTRNRRMPNTNTSGVLGVSMNIMKVKGKVYKRWLVQWRDSKGKSRSKGFSVNKYGSEEAFKEACMYRTKMIEARNLEGAGYAGRHGEVV